MGILAEDKRPIPKALAEIGLKMLDLTVHRADDISMGFNPGPFILHWPGRIAFLDPGISGFKIDTITRFISERPDYDRGMVFIPFDHVDRPFQVSLFPVRIVPESPVRMITHAVRFDVGLIDHIEPVLIAQLIPAGNIRIMTGPDCIDVELFHQPDVLDHAFFRDHASGLGLMFMPVHTFNHDRTTVDQQLPSFYFHPPESGPAADNLYDPP